MTKFKDGDKVVIKTVKDPVADFIKEKIGSVGIVESIASGWQFSSDDECAYDVVFPDGTGYFFFEDELELATDD